MPITKGDYRMTTSNMTIQCATQDRYDMEKQNAIAQGYTVTAEDIPNLTMTLSLDKIISVNDGELP